MNYEKILFLVAQSKLLEDHGETELAHAIWRRIIELFTQSLDDFNEAARDFVPEIPASSPSCEPVEEDGLEMKSRKDLLGIWNVVRGKDPAIKSVHSKAILIAEIRRLRFEQKAA